jgi:hypothetical protein
MNNAHQPYFWVVRTIMSARKTRFKRISIERALQFHYDPVLRKLESAGFSREDAHALFIDVKQFLCLTALHPDRVFVPAVMVDKGWHTFLEFTLAYQMFCHTMLGRFVHHFPKEALPASFNARCANCASCSSGANPIGDIGDGSSLIQATISAAKAAFGHLSKNWDYIDKEHEN